MIGGQGVEVSKTLFYTMGNFIFYRMKTSGGSHCGGMEDVAYATRRRRRIPQAGFFFIYLFIRPRQSRAVPAVETTRIRG